MKAEGYSKLGKRAYVRVKGDIAQMIWFQVSAYGSRDFVPSVSTCLLQLQDRSGLGRRFKGERGADLWLKSAKPEQAEASCLTAFEAYNVDVVPWLTQRASPAQLLASKREESPPESPDATFTGGVVEAMIGNAAGAEASLALAEAGYRKLALDWAEHCAIRVSNLRQALAKGRSKELLEVWRLDGLSHFKLAEAPA